ncbi:hypothetical protein SAMN05216490_2779 [Mucilaginibacter mallensis]|uniref:YXWGXW repeat-containing protein n=1 Tax=Mucilaginibacter mallensis TaxID=652787 RepID=A0A1H1YLP4_MUCMA|nr:hypothetical protein [Mucilaginibacter mallensis]SDT22301.1 hypothetical protein SAMN05216490_2779 [Mucilaginibacter mallensis]
MKKLVLLSAIAISGLFYNTANAQIRIHLGINLFPHHIYVRPAVVDVQPAPVVYTDNAPADYNSDDDYYYLPDVNAYYNVAQQCYYYNDGDNWISAAYLPGEYRNYDWMHARRFEVRSPRPYLHNDLYMNRYHGANYQWAHRDDHFQGGYANHFNGGDQHFDNRGGYAQHFDNRNQNNYNQQYNQNRDNRGQQFNQNRGNRGDDQQRVAQNDRGHDFGRRRF